MFSFTKKKNVTKKVDKRKRYYLMLDTEATNIQKISKEENARRKERGLKALSGFEKPLVYDIGFIIVDKNGKVYEKGSYLVEEILLSDIKENGLMSSAYYSWKLPLYLDKASKGEIKIKSLFLIRDEIFNLMKRYRVNTVVCHNAKFDCNALNSTLSLVTGSKEKYFFPYGVEWYCTLAMSRSLLSDNKTYEKWCNKDKSKRLTPTGRVKLTAEVVYQYITGKYDFIEEHTGLADCMIEKEILAYCLRQRKKMTKSAWGKAYENNQKQIEKMKRNGMTFGNTFKQYQILQEAKFQQDFSKIMR